MSNLRKCLPDGMLVTRGAGYELAWDSIELDAHQFGRLASDGRAALDAHRAEGAASLLAESLALWRGPPLADFTYDAFAQTEIARLEEERLVAIEDHLEPRLRLGQHSAVIGQLEAAVGAHPLRERLLGQLMLALYRAGRQHEALESFRRASTLLRDELGLEPSHALAELEVLILRHDASLDLAPRPATTLPVPPTPFIGRVREVDEVAELLRRETTRLLTLTGAGGSGKTRLALRVAAVCAASYRDGVRFVGFADIADPGLIVPTICQALELVDEPGVAPLKRLIDSLRDRDLLLVLDNLEQFSTGVTVLGELLAACPGPSMLVTSRAPLHLGAEQQYEVPLLEPADAVELFISRAQAASSKLSLDVDVVAQICEPLDRLPLAIELAAARVRALSVEEIRARLDARLPVLGSGPRDAPNRQRTLRATIDWSCNMLGGDERQLFARLAVFAGGWTLSAAEAVCDADLASLEALVDQALVRFDNGRYTMLQTLREYGLEKLSAEGALEQLRARHARWLVELLGEALGPSAGFGDPTRTPIVTERENLRAALEWSEQCDGIETMARLAEGCTFTLWIGQGQLAEADRWLAPALARRAECHERLRAHLLTAGRSLAWKQGDLDKCAALTEEAMSLYRRMHDHVGTVRELMQRGILAAERGDLAVERATIEEVIAYSREHVKAFLAVALCNLGDLEIAEGRLDAARAACEESLALSRQAALGDARGGLASLINLAHIANLQHRHADALELGRRLLAESLAYEDLLMAASALMEIAWPLAEQGHADRAGRLVGAALEFFEQGGISRQRTDMVCERAVFGALRERLEEDALQDVLDAGRGIGVNDAALAELAIGEPVPPA